MRGENPTKRSGFYCFLMSLKAANFLAVIKLVLRQ